MSSLMMLINPLSFRIMTCVIFGLLSVVTVASGQVENPQYKSDVGVFAFCYHDVRNDVVGKLDNDAYAVNETYLIQHFQWLKEHGYTVVSAQQVNEAKKGLVELPEKAVVLSFDDGYSSFYHTIYPLLQLYNYPATFGIVTAWVGDADDEVMIGDELVSKAKFMTWEQVKELSESPLIEIASHSHDLHKGVLSNPQDNTQPAAITRIYSEQSGYETESAYRDRIELDMQTSYDLISEHTGQPPTTFIWPYGAFSDTAWQIAKSIGYETSMVLENGENTLDSNEHIGRFLIERNPSVRDFRSYFLNSSYKYPNRVVHVDLDYVFDEDIEQENRNLSLLLDRIKEMSVSTVYLQAFADPDGDGNADSLYFPNDVLPVRRDLFNRVSWQLRTRAHVEVYAWMPVSAFVSDDEKTKDWGVKSFEDGLVLTSKNNYKRWSIFHPEAKKTIKSIYLSLAQNSKFAGVLYHDDAVLTDTEDVSEHALNYYKKAGLEFASVNELLMDGALNDRWSRIKTDALIAFTNELTDVLRSENPAVKTARNIYAPLILNPSSEKWFAQNFELFLNHYDTTAIMAMPFMENANDHEIWLDDLIEATKRHDVDVDKLVFELQSKDWRTSSLIDTRVLKEQMIKLQQAGFPNYGYYPDDFIINHPEINEIKKLMSLSSYPYKAR